MPNPQSLTGNQTGIGLSTDNTGTDSFYITGNANTVLSGLGNLNVQGFYSTLSTATDTATTVVVKANNGPVADQVVLDGGFNKIYGVGVGTPTQAQLTGGSTVDIGVGLPVFFGQQFVYGNNYVNLINRDKPATTNTAHTAVTLTGPNNAVILNGDASNTIVLDGEEAYLSLFNGQIPVDLAGGNSAVFVGARNDELYGNTTSVQFTGDNNTIVAGDENVTVTGVDVTNPVLGLPTFHTSHNNIALGDGTNSVTLTGDHNTIVVGGGFNTIDTGTGHAVVNIAGAATGSGAAANYSNQPPVISSANALQDANVPQAPKDKVYIRNGNNVVAATYENVEVDNLTPLSVSDGNDLLLLGNGNNSISEYGNSNTIVVGNGINAIESNGNKNLIIVQDTTGVGTDTVALDSGTGNLVSLGNAAGAVSAVGTDSTGATTTNTVVQAGVNNVSVNFGPGTGNIALGNGNDSVTANGPSSHISLGNGNNTVTANGANDTIAIGTAAGKAGNNTVTANGAGTIVGILDGAKATENVTANGAGAIVEVGDGTDTVTANGANAIVVAGNGNDTITANGNGALISVGSGSDTISALGSNNHVIVNAAVTSNDSIALGSNDVLRVVPSGSPLSSGVQTITGGSNDIIYLNDTNVGITPPTNQSTVKLSGSGNQVFIGNGSDTVYLDPSQTNNAVTIQAAAGNIYSSNVEITGFSPNATLDLQGLIAKDGTALNSYANVLSEISSLSGNQYAIQLQGGGSLKLDTTVPFQASEFHFSTNTGLV